MAIEGVPFILESSAEGGGCFKSLQGWFLCFELEIVIKHAAIKCVKLLLPQVIKMEPRVATLDIARKRTPPCVKASLL